jgi:hypothetical protein
LYLLAEWHMAKSRTYDPLRDSSGRYALITAREICEKALKGKDSTEGRSSCANLLNQILAKEVKLEAEQVNTAGEPFRMLVHYKNFTSGYFRIIKMDRLTRERLGNTWSDSFWIKALRLPVVRNFNFSFPDTRDHQLHRIEIKIDSLPTGEYVLIASPDKQFALKSNTLAFQPFYVSNIAYINNGTKYYVLNRKSGAPLSAAKVQVWKCTTIGTTTPN